MTVVRASDTQFLDHLKKINDVFYDQIKIADQKAAYIFTFMLAFLVTSAEGRGVFKIERYVSGDWVVAILSALLGLAVLFSLVSAILVVLPRHRTGATSLYWGGWGENRGALMEARAEGDASYLFDQYAGNVDNLSAINRSKYRFVGFAFRGLLVAVVAYVLLLGYGAGATALPVR
ncbi:MAG: hypothetical protein KF723_14660 [Rhizobiaceae bacterium]|nr:hypothetical protein [Rhizobiaceae bacterium]